MKTSLVLCTGLSLAGLAALPALAQIQVQTKEIGPQSGAAAQSAGAASAQPTPPPCPGMAGLEIGQTRTFSFERMALHEPSKKTVTRDLKVLHVYQSPSWAVAVTVDVTYASDALDAKVVALHYLLDPPANLYEGILERYGKGSPVASDPGMSSWAVPQCGIRLRYRTGMSEKQSRMEEMWVEPLAKPAPAKKKG